MDTSFHASENYFICEECGQCLESRSGLRRHRLRQHLKQDMTFKCTTDACTAAFCEKGELLAHQTSHDEQKHIICNYCNKHFTNDFNLKRHIRCSCSHVDGNQKTCELCGLKFNRLDNLTEYKKSVHEKISFSCSACGISYRWKSSLSRHNKNKHSK